MPTTAPPPTRIRLEMLTVTEPCPADWAAMTPVGDGDRTRFCRHCQKHVYDLSSLPRAAAERLVAERVAAADPTAGDVMCVRLFRRADGTVVTADCDGAWRRTARRARAAWAAVLALPIALAAAARGDRAAVGRMVPRLPPPPPAVAVLGGCPAPMPPATRPTTMPTTAPVGP